MSEAILTLTLNEGRLVALAGIVAVELRPPLCVALHGDLGAGKSTFARALIRALLRDPEHEVPSPTFSLRQDYTGADGQIVHFDLYRIGDASDLDELGFAEAVEAAVAIVEWPERAGNALPADRLDVFLTESVSKEERDVTLVGCGRAEALVAAVGAALRRENVAMRPDDRE